MTRTVLRGRFGEVEMKQSRDWRDEYTIVGKVGEGTFGEVFLATKKDAGEDDEGPSSPVTPISRQLSAGGRLADKVKVALKRFKATASDGLSQTTIREILILQRYKHRNLIAMREVYINMKTSQITMAFEYASHDVHGLLHIHRQNKKKLHVYTVKSLLWQTFNGLKYLHDNCILHRDLKPANLLIIGDGIMSLGTVKIGDFGLARCTSTPLRGLAKNGTVVTIWNRAPELLFGSQHYHYGVDMWAMGCIFAELLAVRPLFQSNVTDGENPQNVQLSKIFEVLSPPTAEDWPYMESMPNYSAAKKAGLFELRNETADSHGAASALGEHLTIEKHEDLETHESVLHLLHNLLLYDPDKRLNVNEAANHPFFAEEPLPGSNVFQHASSLGYKYPPRHVARHQSPSANITSFSVHHHEERL